MKILLVGGCGYIGSFLYQKLLNEHYETVVCDRQSRGNPGLVPTTFDDYKRLPKKLLSEFDVVLWFAGHSSVQQATNDPSGAIRNNCLDLFEFASRLSVTAKFIYASTGSLYSKSDFKGKPSKEKSLVTIPEQNAYDSSKFAFDYLAKNFLRRSYGLRMGTLCGYSANIRQELVFNSMNLSAVYEGLVRLKNGESRRTLLFLDDLWVMIKSLIINNHAPGFYNVGSHSSSLSELAATVANTWGAQVIYGGDSKTYSFSLDCTRMRLMCGSGLDERTIEERSRQFIAEYQNEKQNQ